MTAAAFIDAGPKPAPERDPDSAAAHCRTLWATVLIHAYTDWWARAERAKGGKAAIKRIRSEALRYFASRDGREVLALAGVNAAPETLADAAIDPTAKRRMIAAYRVAQ